LSLGVNSPILVRMRRSLFAGLALAIAAPVSAAILSTPSLARIVLRPGEVGKGDQLRVIPGGNRVQGQVTLDLCGQRYRSEKLRAARLQVVYLDAANHPLLSNEVVRYRPGGAAQAMSELQHVATHCPKGPVTGPVHGEGPMRWRLTRVTDRRLLQPYVAVIVHGNGKEHGHRVSVTAFAVYQIRKNVLSAVYTSGEGSIQAQRSLGLRAAAKTAAKLRALVR
jgi:hypothetical protein